MNSANVVGGTGTREKDRDREREKERERKAMGKSKRKECCFLVIFSNPLLTSALF